MEMPRPPLLLLLQQAEAYGERMPLSALATTLVRDPQLLVVNVFDPAVRHESDPRCLLCALTPVANYSAA